MTMLISTGLILTVECFECTERMCFPSLNNCDGENLYKHSANANTFVSNAVHSTGNASEHTKV